MSTEPRESEGDEEGLPGSAGHFTTEQVAQLNARLDRKLLKQNPDGKTYLEGYTVINTLNRIFGYGSWSREVLARWQEEGHDGDEGILYGATVRLIVTAPDGSQSHHDDDGYCVAPMSRKTGKVSLQSRETARKGAVTDALKRAARSFGEQLANNLYDKGYMAARDADERQAAQAQQPARTQTQRPPLRTANTAAEEDYAAVTALLRADTEGAEKLPKPLGQMTPEELRKTRDWLDRRARAIKKGQTVWVDPTKPLRPSGARPAADDIGAAVDPNGAHIVEKAVDEARALLATITASGDKRPHAGDYDQMRTLLLCIQRADRWSGDADPDAIPPAELLPYMRARLAGYETAELSV